MQSIKKCTPVVYVITNTKNNKSYYGSSGNDDKRWQTHQSTLSNGKHHNFFLQKSWNKYGADAFEFKVLMECLSIEEARKAEKELLEKHFLTKKCFNLSKVSSEEIVYRNVLFRDAHDLVVLMKQLGYEINEKEMGENITKYSNKGSNQCAWVAEKDGFVLACVAVSLTDHFHLTQSFLRVNTMIVDEKQRGLGIGKKLMSIVEKYAKICLCSHIELTSGVSRTEAHHFYKSLNFNEYTSKKYFIQKLRKEPN